MITAAVAFVDLGPFNTVVALVIATFKALLVVLFFMHVKYTSEKLTKMVIVVRDFLAFPLAGAQHGRLRHASLELMRAALSMRLISDILRSLHSLLLND